MLSLRCVEMVMGNSRVVVPGVVVSGVVISGVVVSSAVVSRKMVARIHQGVCPRIGGAIRRRQELRNASMVGREGAVGA